jgi:hypothetical protein
VRKRAKIIKENNVDQKPSSYSMTLEHKKWVLELYRHETRRYAILDQWDLKPGDLPLWNWADHLIAFMICTDKYVEKANLEHDRIQK